MLDNAGEVGAPHPLHILQCIDSIEPGDEVAHELRFEVLVEAICSLND